MFYEFIKWTHSVRSRINIPHFIGPTNFTHSLHNALFTTPKLKLCAPFEIKCGQKARRRSFHSAATIYEARSPKPKRIFCVMILHCVALLIVHLRYHSSVHRAIFVYVQRNAILYASSAFLISNTFKRFFYFFQLPFHHIMVITIIKQPARRCRRLYRVVGSGCMRKTRFLGDRH